MRGSRPPDRTWKGHARKADILAVSPASRFPPLHPHGEGAASSVLCVPMQRTPPAHGPVVRSASRPAGRGARVVVLLAALFLGTSPGARAVSAQDVPARPPEAPRGVIADLDAAPRPFATATRVDGDIRIDGRLDEAVWDAARVIDQFTQQKPDQGYPATDRTEVRIIYDDDALYIGAVLYDEDPSSLVIPTLQRDPNTRDGDAFGIALDPFLDRSSGFTFFVNPGGAFRDGQVNDDGRNLNFAWEGVVTVRTEIHDEGWTLEMEIPWVTLRYDPSRPIQSWGLNLLRRNRSKNEDSTWAPMDRRWALFTMSRAGTLEGLEGLSSGQPFFVKPYGLSSRATGSIRPETEVEADAGVDLKYGLTSGLTADLTLNTDFSQVEVDQQQVNLTRFSLFFPELREFFLENAGVFQFGDRGGGPGLRTGASSRDFSLFFSRRIGLAPDGSPLPILGGGRLSGTAGPFELGVLNIQTREQGEAPAENFAVARLRARPIDGLDVGGIFVNRSVTSTLPADSVAFRDNRSFGIDANYQTLSDRLFVQSYLAASEGDRTDGSPLERDLAGRLSVEWRSATLEAVAMVRSIGEDFAPGVGFVRRDDLLQRYGLFGIRRTVDWPIIQLVSPFVEFDHFQTTAGVLETRQLAAGVRTEFWDGGQASIEVRDRFERVFEPFSVRGATIEPGSYDFTEVQGDYQFNRARPVSASLNATTGGYFSGSRTSLGAQLFARWSYRLVASLSINRNRIDLPDLDDPISVDVYGLRLEAYASPTLLGSALVQYNEASDELVTNVRFNWRHAPLSDVFLVYTERRDRAAGAVLDRLITLKVTRLFAL